MPRTVLDVTRLLTRARHAVATGVDRVELAYARRALAQPADRVGFAAVVGKRVVPLPAPKVAALIAALDAKWSGVSADDGAARALVERLGAAPPPASSMPRPAFDNAARQALALRAVALMAINQKVATAQDVYCHVSHIRLDRPDAFARVRAGGARLTMLIHDLIPIRFPEYGRPGEDARHRRRMTTALRHATALIANSADTARDLAAFAREIGVEPPPIVTAPLGLEPGFASGATPLCAARPYFVTLGTVEPRKNHLLLLHVWRRLAERMGQATPMLVVVGRRGWENEMVVDLLERSPAIQAHVVEVNALSDVALAAVIKGARALLFPSFAEGYGLPLGEAMALGAPVIATDLPAFREIAGAAGVVFLDPLDGPAWEAAISDFARDPSSRRDAAIERLQRYEPPSWDAHFEMVRAVTGLD